MTQSVTVVTWGDIIRGFSFLVGAALVALWILRLSLKKSDDPKRLLTHWLISAIAIGGFLYLLSTMEGLGKLVLPFAAVGLGVVLSILWAPTIATTVFKPITDLMDGGSQEIDPQPFYSTTEAKRKQGLPQEALAEVRKQLEKFPDDPTGNILLATILAEDLNDLPGAAVAVDRFVQAPGVKPQPAATALHSLADWHLKYGLDPDGARAALQRIVEANPDTAIAHSAAHRIAHLPTLEQLLTAREKGNIDLVVRPHDHGLRSDYEALAAPEKTARELLTDYIKQLETHPQDFDTRERLALLYAREFQRVDLATDQLNQLVAQPGATPQQLTRWLNHLADICTKYGRDRAGAEKALGQIIERYPQTAMADAARYRLAVLGVELHGDKEIEIKKMGHYENQIGLKQAQPLAAAAPRIRQV